MLWSRMVILIFLWNSVDITSETFVRSSKHEEARERGSTKKDTEYLYKSLRNPKPSLYVASDSSSALMSHSKSKSLPTLTHLRVTPEPFIETDDDAGDREGFGDYEDIIYNNREYPQDETSQKERDNLPRSSASNEIAKLGFDPSVTETDGSSPGESEVSQGSISSTNESQEEVFRGEKLSEGNLSQSLDDDFQHDKRLGNEVNQNSEQQEKLLLQKLMGGYERDVRPVRNASHPVIIRVGITLTQIFDMDEKQQVLTTNVWLDQEWNDEMLRWDPEDYGGLKTIRLPCDRIWLPDIVLYNKLQYYDADDYTRGYMPSRAMVSFDGNVFWPPPTKFRSTCSVDVTYFPFDDQICFLKLGSWTYNGFQVDVTNRTSAVDLSNYISNGEWELVKAVQQRNVVYYSCCPEPFPDVTVTLVIQRKTLYYIYNIVLPCIMLSALTLLVFCLPPDSGEKIALGITVLLAFSVFMLAINESLPETSESIPLIGVYLTIVMAITSVSVIMTVVVLNLHYLGPKVRPVPVWLTWLLSKENRSQIRQRSLLLPMTQREPKSGSLKRNHVVITSHRSGSGGETYSVEVANDILENMGIKDVADGSSESNTNENTGNYSNSTRRTNCSGGTSSQSMASSYSHRPDGQLLVKPRKTSQQNALFLANNQDDQNKGKDVEQTEVMTELLSSIKLLIQKQEDIEAQNNLVAEWRLVAQEVDRILFWIFFIFTVTSSTVILLILPVYKRGGFAFLGLDSNSSYTSGTILTE